MVSTAWSSWIAPGLWILGEPSSGVGAEMFWSSKVLDSLLLGSSGGALAVRGDGLVRFRSPHNHCTALFTDFRNMR